MVTHAVVAPNDPEPGVLGPGAAVVTPAWVEWAVKFGALPPPGAFVAFGIFRGVVACSAGMKEEDRYAIVSMLLHARIPTLCFGRDVLHPTRTGAVWCLDGPRLRT